MCAQTQPSRLEGCRNLWLGMLCQANILDTSIDGVAFRYYTPDNLISFNMQLGLERSLNVLVKWKFEAARAAQALIFSDTELSILHTLSGAPVGVCPDT